MKKKWFFYPLAFAAAHSLFVLFFWLINTKGEVEAGWEYVFGIIDFAGYFTIGIPRFIGESWCYALWFGGLGGIQWFIIGLIFSSISRLLKPQIKNDT